MANQSGPSALRIILMLGIAMVLIVGVQVMAAYKKLNAPTKEGSQYSAMLAEQEASTAPMTDADRVKFVKDLENAKAQAAEEESTDREAQARLAGGVGSFARKLYGVWRARTVQGGMYEFLGGIRGGESFMQVEVADTYAVPNISEFKIVAIDDAQTMRVKYQFGEFTLKFQPCSLISTELGGGECLVWWDGQSFREVARRERDMTAEEKHILDSVIVSD